MTLFYPGYGGNIVTIVTILTSVVFHQTSKVLVLLVAILETKLYWLGREVFIRCMLRGVSLVTCPPFQQERMYSAHMSAAP